MDKISKKTPEYYRKWYANRTPELIKKRKEYLQIHRLKKALKNHGIENT